MNGKASSFIFTGRFYEECPDLRRLVRQLGYYQDEYNLGGSDTEMSLVFFADAVRHLLRIARILRNPRGNAVLIGLAGETISYHLSIVRDRTVSAKLIHSER